MAEQDRTRSKSLLPLHFFHGDVHQVLGVLLQWTHEINLVAGREDLHIFCKALARGYEMVYL